MDLKVLTNPTVQHFKEIKKWLQEEDYLTGEGFYCQLHTLENSFLKKKLIVITERDMVVGFLTYYFYEHIVNIEIVEVKPDNRRNGIGKFLLHDSISYFVENGALVAQLFCSPVSSEKVWKRMGFVNFPDGIIRESKIYLYQILVETAKLYITGKEAVLIELWDFEDYRDEFPPKWRWVVNHQEKSNKLMIPIIHPCGEEWSVAYKVGSDILEKRTVKYFDEKKHYNGHFLIVLELER